MSRVIKHFGPWGSNSHKYIKRIRDGEHYRYFYSQEEYNHWVKKQAKNKAKENKNRPTVKKNYEYEGIDKKYGIGYTTTTRRTGIFKRKTTSNPDEDYYYYKRKKDKFIKQKDHAKSEAISRKESQDASYSYAKEHLRETKKASNKYQKSLKMRVKKGKKIIRNLFG